MDPIRSDWHGRSSERVNRETRSPNRIKRNGLGNWLGSLTLGSIDINRHSNWKDEGTGVLEAYRQRKSAVLGPEGCLSQFLMANRVQESGIAKCWRSVRNDRLDDPVERASVPRSDELPPF